ncbi:hypothetical protein GCM10022228_16330 [Halomonas cibimaris]|uniref:Preprotein translocase subunit YajC n=1 Tax=Halomonas cibimaris TaxID=657012 RepID=A0ABP7LSL9_9GAMM
MKWLIIVAAVMMAISPVMWLKPSPRQRQRDRLRELARQYDVKVERREAPLLLVKDDMPAYRLRYPGDRPGPDFTLVRDAVASQDLARYTDGWRFRIAPLRPLPRDAQQQLAEMVSALPDDVWVVESNQAALTLWWWESSTAEALSPALKAAAALRDTLCGHADHPGVSPLRAPAMPEKSG